MTMTEKPKDSDESQIDPGQPVDDARAKFLAALAKKQGNPQGGVSTANGGKGGAKTSSGAHTSRMFQRKSGSS